jgi:hypothetical protein
MWYLNCNLAGTMASATIDRNKSTFLLPGRDTPSLTPMTAQHFIGTVTKISNLKTATVTIARHVEHPILRKVRVHPRVNVLQGFASLIGAWHL